MNRYRQLASYAKKLRKEADRVQAILDHFKGKDPNDMDELELLQAMEDADAYPYDLGARATFVEYGYQLDLYDGHGQMMACKCHDFGDNYPIGKIREAAAKAIIEAFEKLERRL